MVYPEVMRFHIQFGVESNLVNVENALKLTLSKLEATIEVNSKT